MEAGVAFGAVKAGAGVGLGGVVGAAGEVEDKALLIAGLAFKRSTIGFDFALI